MDEKLIYRNIKYNAKNIFTGTSVFMLAFSILSFTMLVVIKTLIAVFDVSIIDQFKSIYYITSYSNSTVSLINGIFGAVVILCLCLITFGLFFSIFSASKENIPKLIRGIKLIKFSVILGLIVSIITAVCSIASVSVINYYAVKAAAFQQTVNNNSRKLFILTIAFGAVSIILEIAMIRFLIGMEHYFNGTAIIKIGSGLAGFISGVGAVSAAAEFISLLYNIVMVDYGTENFSPASLASDIVNIIMSVSLIIFFISLMMSVYNYSSNVLADDEYFDDFYDDMVYDEEIEVRVFSEDKNYTSEAYSNHKLMMPPFDIPHTEYPRNNKIDY